MPTLDRIHIVGLRGTQQIDIVVDDNTLVIVGENGSGKTTTLKLVFAALSGSYHQILSHVFEKIVVTIDGQEYVINREDLVEKTIDIDERLYRHLPSSVYRRIKSEYGKYITPYELNAFVEEQGLPLRLIQEFDSMQDQLSIFDSELNKSPMMPLLADQIIYLPTYRRIEENLEQIMSGRYSFESDRTSRGQLRRKERSFGSKSFVELVDFGMDDVKETINKTCSDLVGYSENRFKELAYMNLGDVIERKYLYPQEKDEKITENEIDKFRTCLSRSETMGLSETQIDKLLHSIEAGNKGTEGQILLYYFKRLVSLQDDLEKKEQRIVQFCNVCNKYLSDSGKEMIYDKSSFKIQICKLSAGNQLEIDLSDLSSGEKQVISLFSHLYISQNSSYFVIIDEPELSLSVPWQKKFLEDMRNSEKCSGIIAATHSPFIYDNSLIKYAHSLSEFTKE